jgi:glycosyltransferase involved in cell wall biosynthesis
MTARVAVYDRFWRSQGGGERHVGMLAQVLTEDGCQVDLVGHEPTDLDELGEHLGLDLSRCRFLQVPDRGDAWLAERTAGYDLLVNGTYGSRLQPRTPKAAYLCYFPTPADHDLQRWRRVAIRWLGPWVRGTTPNLDFGAGWFPPEGGRRRRWTWTTDDAVLTLPAGRRVLRLDLGRPGAPGGAALVLVDDDGSELSRLEVTTEFSRQVVDLGERDRGTEVRFTSPTFSPGPADTRELGVAVSRARLAGKTGARERLAGRWPWLHRDPRDLRWLDAYDSIMVNSSYTRGYVERWWQRPGDVLHPPIAVHRLTPAAQRERRIVTVGRFFSPGLGHAKRQLEMVEAFGRLDLPGWTLSVLGGCEPSQLPYLEQVRRAAQGLEVEIVANAPRALVEQRLTTSSIFWAATGLGEDTRARPWNAEHFGMTTVEAMAGGCVPVVIDGAGQQEIVRDGIDGLRWETVEQLLEQTRQVAGDEDLRARMANSAIRRAHDYDEDAFRAELRGIIATRHLLP